MAGTQKTLGIFKLKLILSFHLACTQKTLGILKSKQSLIFRLTHKKT
jgi:hypothetical protein